MSNKAFGIGLVSVAFVVVLIYVLYDAAPDMARWLVILILIGLLINRWPALYKLLTDTEKSRG